MAVYLVEIMRSPTAASDLMDRSSEHIIDQRRRYRALSVCRIVVMVIVSLTAWVSGLSAPDLQKDTEQLVYRRDRVLFPVFSLNIGCVFISVI